MEKFLVLRRNTGSAIFCDDVVARPPSAPSVGQRAADAPTPSHKRKQSDAVASLAQLDITSTIQEDSKTKTRPSLSPIEQGTAADLEEEGGRYDGGGGRRWKSSFSLSPSQLLTLFLLLAAATTLRSVRSRTEPDEKVAQESPSEYVGYDEVGEPLEARVPGQDWTELFRSPERFPPLTSSGPRPADPEIGGLHAFENVCVTNNVDAPKPPVLDTTSRGLIYFTKDEATAKNPRRCVPCSKKDMDGREDAWYAAGDSDLGPGHACGMTGLHAMFSTSVADYNECTADVANRQSMIRSRQTQSPSKVQRIHFVLEPTFLLQFDAHSREKGLLDMLLTYLPHYHRFRTEGGDFPFSLVVSHAAEDCLGGSRNWFCEVARRAGAWGPDAREVPLERAESTLYCFRSLYYNQPGYGLRVLGTDIGLVTKEIMDEFRDELFGSLALDAPRDTRDIKRKDAERGVRRPLHVLLYGNGLWRGLDELVENARTLSRYHGLAFRLLDDLDALAMPEQAAAFNAADATVTASGDHTANAIFSSDGAFHAEAGCSPSPPLRVGDGRFMALLRGTHRSVAECPPGGRPSGDGACVTCEGDGRFVMTAEAFHDVLDEILEHREEKASFQKDSL